MTILVGVSDVELLKKSPKNVQCIHVCMTYTQQSYSLVLQVTYNTSIIILFLNKSNRPLRLNKFAKPTIFG